MFIRQIEVNLKSLDFWTLRKCYFYIAVYKRGRVPIVVPRKTMVLPEVGDLIFIFLRLDLDQIAKILKQALTLRIISGILRIRGFINLEISLFWIPLMLWG